MVNASDVLNNPQTPQRDSSAAPGKFDKGYDAITAPSGEVLQLMTNSDVSFREAWDVGYIMAKRYNSDYIIGRLELQARLRVAEGARGRQDIIALTKAAGADNDETRARKRTFRFASEADD